MADLMQIDSPMGTAMILPCSHKAADTSDEMDLDSGFMLDESATVNIMERPTEATDSATQEGLTIATNKVRVDEGYPLAVQLEKLELQRNGPRPSLPSLPPSTSHKPRKDKVAERLEAYRSSKTQSQTTHQREVHAAAMMPDQSDRPRNGRSFNGNHANQNNNRKRRYNERDDDNSHDRRHPQNRKRHELPTIVRLGNELRDLATKALRAPEDEVRSIAKLVVDNHEEDNVRTLFCDQVLLLVTQQPGKIVFLAAVVQHVNDSRPELVKQLLESTGGLAQRCVRSGDWRGFKDVLRFLASLQPLFSDDGVFPVLDELFQRTIDLQTASPDDVLGLLFVKIILLTIPYSLAANPDGLQGKTADILAKTDIVASAPRVVDSVVQPFVPTSENAPAPTLPDLLQLLQKQLQAEASKSWPLSFIPRPYSREISNSGGTHEISKHTFPSIIISAPVNPGAEIMFPEIYFSMFTGQDIASVPPLTDLASTVIRDVIVDSIDLSNMNRNHAAELLIELDCYWAPKTFAKRATAINKLKNIPEGQSTWKPEDMALDAVFSQLLQLPAPEHKLIYYHAVVTEACKLAANAIAPTLGRSIRYLFKNLEILDLELQYRFLDWFSHHLSNFDFRWKWNEWDEDLKLSKLHPKRVFITSALDKEIRIAYAQRVKKSMPEDWQAQNVITDAQINDQPLFKFDDNKTPFAQLGRDMYALLRKRTHTDEEVQALVESIESQARTQGVQDPATTSTDIFITSICHIGSKSISHILLAIEKSKDRLLAIGPASDAARLQVITSVADYWQDHPGIAVNIIDKLLNYTVLTPVSVVQWTLTDHMDSGRALASTMSLELISATMHKVCSRMRQIVSARTEAVTRAADAMSDTDDQVKHLDNTLIEERKEMLELFTMIIDAVTPVAQAAQDGMIEDFDGNGTASGGASDLGLLQAWGGRWLKMFTRRLAVEEATVGDAAVQIRARVAKIQSELDIEIVAAEAQAAEALAVAAEKREQARTEARLAREKKRQEDMDAKATAESEAKTEPEEQPHAQDAAETDETDVKADMDIAE